MRLMEKILLDLSMPYSKTSWVKVHRVMQDLAHQPHVGCPNSN